MYIIFKYLINLIDFQKLIESEKYAICKNIKTTEYSPPWEGACSPYSPPSNTPLP